MGNLALIDQLREVREQRLGRARNVSHSSLELISKPLAIGQPVAEESLLHGLWCNVRDALFPTTLPPLELASQPIPVPDLLAVKRSPLSSTLSAVMHVGILALLIWFVMQARKQVVVPPQPVQVTHLEIPFIPVTVPAPKAMGGGGGGGAHQLVQANKGHLPPVAKTQITPVETLKIDHPKLAAAPTIVAPPQVKIPQTNHLPLFGDTQSAQVALVSQGGGTGGGFGQARGGGIGSGHAGGVGPGSTAGYGGGIMSVGGGVAAPRVIHRVDPEFSDQARQNKYQGVVSIQLIVDPQGNPVDIRVLRHLGMGLDERAIAAVRQYKFQPAMYQGHPVPVQIVIDVDFHLN